MAENPDKSTPESEEPVATRLILVRHGKTATTGQVLPGRAHGLLLAEEGRSQAEEVAKELAFIEKIAAIYSSPLERAMETAAPLAAARQMVPHVDERLYECDFGSWTGRRLDELTKLPEWRLIQHSPSKFTFPEGESFRSMSTRMVDFLEWVHATHRGETVVAFVVGKDPAPQVKDLKDFLTLRLAKYKIPREIVFLDGLPHTPTGKIKKFELRDRV